MSSIPVIDIPLELDPELNTAPGAKFQFENQDETGHSNSRATDRTYQGDERTPYWLPNDKTERNRLDLQHKQFATMLEGRYGFAPLQDPGFAADIAGGTGAWAFEFAEQFPNCKVVSTDINENIPSSSLKNLSFLQHDADKENWDLSRDTNDTPEIKLDYVHLRFVVACFNSTKQVFQNAYDSLKPGGYIELCEAEFTLQSDDDSVPKEVSDMFALIRDATSATGRDMEKAVKYVPWLKEVGFVDINDKVVKWPMTPWAKHPIHKQVGQMQLSNFPKVWSAMEKLFEFAKFDKARVQEVKTKGLAALQNPACHPWVACHFIWARKPLENSK